ncbi:MAG: glycosyltransferase family A protein, partial [Acidimicrobiales bacterium]
MDPQPPGEPAPPEPTAPGAGAPPVVAVVVTHDPGPWFEEVLSALGAQDYPDLSVLVIDADSAEDPTARVAATLPSAFVRRIDH